MDDLSLQSYWASERITDVPYELERVFQSKQTLLSLIFLERVKEFYIHNAEIALSFH
jgi:hypothetical protein